MTDELNANREKAVGSEPMQPSRSIDSFDVPVKKSPLFLYAMLQIPILIFMVIMIYILYQSQFS